MAVGEGGLYRYVCDEVDVYELLRRGGKGGEGGGSLVRLLRRPLTAASERPAAATSREPRGVLDHFPRG